MKQLFYPTIILFLLPLITYQCHYTCGSCFWSGPYACFSCGTNSVTHRSPAASYSCPCDFGYADSGVTNCYKLVCHYSCTTCDGSVTQCHSCNSGAHRSLIANTCVCTTGYYDDGSNQMCATCNNDCYTCSGSSTTCQSCNSGHHRTKSGNTCPCNTGYFDNGNALCASCIYKCLTCVGTSTNCTACKGTNRNADPATCTCATGYYDDGVNSNCQACHRSCVDCSDGLSCISCNNTKHRVQSTLINTCACNTTYYDDGTNQLCADCHPHCLTCSGSAETNCITCNQISFRQFNSGAGSCDCYDGYFSIDTATQQCGICHVSCQTCSSSTNVTCLSCNSAQQRVTDSAGGCICKSGFYEDSINYCQGCQSTCLTCSNGTACDTCIVSENTTIDSASGLCSCHNTSVWYSPTSTCIACDYRCQTCDTQFTNCTGCPASSFRTYHSNTCDCDLYYYDDGSNAACVACDYTCHSCDVNGCLSCSSTHHRQISGTSCNCAQGYFDNGSSNQMCFQCLPSCKSCTNASECATCQTSEHLSVNSTTKLCDCEDYYFENSFSVCQRCMYSCLSCDNDHQCLTCDAAKFRQYEISSETCVCMVQYYDDGGNQLCKACDYDCETCTSAGTCVTCDISLYRQIDTDFRCSCIDGYSQNSTQKCQTCHYSCITCSALTDTDCLTCNATAFRIKEPSTDQCLCKDGYYDDGSSQQCVICHYSCQTCTDGVSCALCDGGIGRTINTFCDCPTDHFYDDGSTQPCYDCHYTCKTCAQDDICLTCDALQFRQMDADNLLCQCMDRYYDDTLDNQRCLACPYMCVTCSNSLACETCNGSSFRFDPPNLCPCIEKYFDNNTELCVACHHSCETCTNDTQCQTCDSVKERQYDSGTKLCICSTSFYDDGTNQLCGTCYYSCLTCETTSYNCLSCNTSDHRQLVSTQCPCQIYYFDDLVNSQCLACHYSCLTCSDNSTCDSCNSSVQRQAEPTTDLCRCMDGYYDDGQNQDCVPCEDSCMECVDDTACTDCNATLFRQINRTADYNGSIEMYCACFYRYYSPAQDAACQPCHYSCQVCSGPNATDCLFCNSPSHRTLDMDECLCDDNYYDGGSLQMCLNCNTACLVCTGPLTTDCTSCNTTFYLLIATTTCHITCPITYFDKNTTMTCQLCSSNCEVCVDQTQCTQCATGYPLYEKQCLDTCPIYSTYEEVSINECIDCPTTCLTCDSLAVCTSCIPDHYLDDPLDQCFQCHQHCKGCFGPAQNQCQDCEYPLYFKNHQCFNITCPFHQYIDSHRGCLNCSDLFSHSLTCTITEATLCSGVYKIKGGVCAYCTEVPGYNVTATGDCSQICGDGVLIDYQCDDGNTIDGDGCSSNCIIEEGWHCQTNSSASQCELQSDLSLSVKRFFKYGGQNKLLIQLALSIPVILSNSFNLVIISINTQLYSWQYEQSSDLNTVSFIISYQTDIKNRKINLSYQPSRRLLADFNVSLSETFTIESYPPAIYYQDTILNSYTSFKSIIFILSIVLLALCLCLVPKKMHFHSVTMVWIPAQIYIFYGVVTENITDWIKWSVQDLSPLALIGGFSIGGTASNSPFLKYPSQISQNAGIIICVSLFIWIIYGICSTLHRKCRKMPNLIIYLRYFTFSIQLCIFFHLTFSALNTIYNSSLTSQISAINVCISIFVNIFILAILSTLWALAYLLPVQEEDDFQKADATYNSGRQNKSMKQTSSSFDFQFDLKSRGEQGTHARIKIMDTQENKSEERTHQQNQPIKQVKKNQQPTSYIDQWLIFDYAELYRPNSNYAKYLLPFFFTKIWVSIVLAVFLQSYLLYFFAVLCFLNLLQVTQIIIFRPYSFMFSNIKIITIELLFTSLNALMVYYSYQAQSSIYETSIQFIAVILILCILIIAIVFMVFEHIFSWRAEIWSKLQPCLISLRLRGRRQVHPLQKRNRIEKIEVEEVKIEEKQKQEEEMDAFFARMIKKQNIQRQYRKERMMRQPKRVRNYE